MALVILKIHVRSSQINGSKTAYSEYRGALQHLRAKGNFKVYKSLTVNIR
jgi:hypothetical protein